MNKDGYGDCDQKYKAFDCPEERYHPDGPFMKSCCCFSLRTGCLIHGWLNLILLGVSCAIHIIFFCVAFNLDDLPEEDKNTLKYVLLGWLVPTLIILFLQIELLTGVYKKNFCLLQGFVIGNSILLSFGIIVAILLFINGAFKQGIILFIGLCYHFWNIIVVHCYSIELKIEVGHTHLI